MYSRKNGSIVRTKTEDIKWTTDGFQTAEEADYNESMIIYDENILDYMPAGFSPTIMYQELRREHEQWEADLLFDMWFHNYSFLDIVDTGLYDCYKEEFVEKMQEEADLIHCQIDFVEGSNYLLEKLVSGRWDQQFLVLEPGHTIKHGDFF